jgi:hypothetical protein
VEPSEIPCERIDTFGGVFPNQVLIERLNREFSGPRTGRLVRGLAKAVGGAFRFIRGVVRGVGHGRFQRAGGVHATSVWCARKLDYLRPFGVYTRCGWLQARQQQRHFNRNGCGVSAFLGLAGNRLRVVLGGEDGVGDRNLVVKRYPGDASAGFIGD